jgi:hypothetical protein
MKTMKTLALAALMAVSASVSGAAPAAAPDAANVKAVHDLLAAMQAEKMMRMTAGMARYPDPAQRQATADKVDKVAPEVIYTRLAVPVARLVSTETARQMTRFYTSSYGKRVLHQTYNSGPSLYQQAPTPSAAEKADLKRPEYLKADKAFKEVEQAIHHETFVLVTAIANGK